LLLFLKGTSKARNTESKLQFHSIQIDQQLTDPEKDRYIGTHDDFVAENCSAKNSIHSKE
jgi:hypothetical protein